MQRTFLSWRRSVVLSGVWLLAAACSGSGSSAPTAARLLVSADTVALDPAVGANVLYDRRLLAGRPVANVYRLTTPANEPFAFDLTTWQPNLTGEAEVRVRHLADGGNTPTSPTSLLEAGINLRGGNLLLDQPWVAGIGEGFARVSVHGTITADQVLAVEVGDGPVDVVAIAIGPRSAIRRPDQDTTNLPAGMTRTTLYSSAAWQFGMPAVAVSGDRTSVVCYEGDQQRPEYGERFELRLQHDAATGQVTGGASQLGEWWAGAWRDHEVAALFNVLAVARSEAGQVRLRLSFDRGATFAQEMQFPSGAGQSRLVQIAMAADYSLALVFWRSGGPGMPNECVLVEGQPLAFDGNGSPTWFSFPSQEVLWQLPADGTPLTSGIAWSEGGDLVVGYGGTWFENPSNPGNQPPTWVSIAEFRCATKLYGQPRIDRLVHRERLVGVDPTVAVRGSGSGLQIYYAFEASDGIRLAHSGDAGGTFTTAATFGQPGDHLPAVFCRPGALGDRVDVLYLAPRVAGTELLMARWPAGLAGPREDVRLVEATSTPVPVGALPGGGHLPFGNLVTQVGWLGYDAVLAGDDLVVVVDEHTGEAWTPLIAAPFRGQSWVLGPQLSSPGGFRASEPPPLAPGLTEPLRAPRVGDAHQLLLLRLP